MLKVFEQKYSTNFDAKVSSFSKALGIITEEINNFDWNYKILHVENEHIYQQYEYCQKKVGGYAIVLVEFQDH